MSLFGSLYTGVSGLSAQSQATAMISNNIANVNTVGFKRSEAAFYSLVTTEGRSSRYSPGTVSVNRIQRVTSQGPVQQSSSSTDTSISGNGFYPVKRDNGMTGGISSEYLYTRNGQFSEDSQGFLVNTAGFYLYGWPLDQNGNLPSNQGDLSSLVPIDVAFLGGLTRPTNEAELALMLNSNATNKTLSALASSPPDFSRGINMYDSLGNGQNVTFQYTKTYGPQGTAASTRTGMTSETRLVADLGLTNATQFSVSIEGG
ncbi:MAG: flagellar biosynthesis protein FlgE, partial [Micavibrio aeruginosavorus]